MPAAVTSTALARLVVVAPLMLALFAQPAAPGPPAPPRIAKFVVQGSTQATHLGRVALSDDLLAVGAVGYRTFSGAVFLFDRGTGQQVGKLSMAAPETYASFGSALAFDGDALVVGAPDVGDVGHAARYDLATGVELATYAPAVPVPGSQFGAQVVVDGEVVAIGAPGTFPFPPDDGHVYAFDRASGVPLAAIASPDPTFVLGPNNFFGAGLAVDEGLLAVGSPGAEGVGTAFVYELATGAMLHRLEEPPGFRRVAFGTSVAIGGGRVAVGDPQTDGYVGAVHVYDVATGDHLYTVTNRGGAPGTVFGETLALDRTLLVVGDRHAELGAAHGVVTVHDAATGALLHTLTGAPAAMTHAFGSALDLHGGVLAVGDNQDNQVAIYAGAAYLVSFH